jgi:hypothetical protein
MRSSPGCWLVLVLAAWPIAVQAEAPDGTIRVDVAKPGGRVSRYLTGACIEDVNHEIYGGIYSQMIFGESFQEPAFSQPLKGFVAHGGSWSLAGETLLAGGGPGPKLISNHAPFSSGEVSVEVYFPDRGAGNAGLIVKTNRPGLGADNFDGYEVSLDPAARILRLGRHRHNWEPIKDSPCDVPAGQWLRLVVRMTETSLEVLVNGKSIVKYEDRKHPLKSGGLGLRQWQRAARYRKLWIKTNGRTQTIPFEANPDDTGPVSGMWRVVRRDKATGICSLEKDRPFVGTQSQRITFRAGEGEFGVENQGLNRWGLSFIGGKPYEGTIWARAEKPIDLFASLENRDSGKVHAEVKLAVSGKDWQCLNFTLTPEGSHQAGRFVLKLKRPGSVVLG